MLLRNESRVKHIIEIKLVFDDNTTREIEVYEGQCVHISYRRNGCVKCGLGVIKEIKPYIKKVCCGIIETAVITLDMSQDNYACVEKIELDDIVDIYQPCCNCPSMEDSKPPVEEVVIVHHCCCCKCDQPEEGETSEEEIETPDNEETTDENEEVVIHE